jgi:hypothetical protein
MWYVRVPVLVLLLAGSMARCNHGAKECAACTLLQGPLRHWDASQPT